MVDIKNPVNISARTYHTTQQYDDDINENVFWNARLKWVFAYECDVQYTQ